MRALKRLIGRRDAGETDIAGTPRQKAAQDDRPVIHQTVPDAVLRGDRPEVTAPDRSWLDAVPVAATPAAAPREARPAAPRTASAPASAPVFSNSGARVVSAEPTVRDPNAPAEGRPRFPCGWLVVVEGPGVGQWFVLERGVSHIGSAEGQTVRLDFGDASVRSSRHAALAYDARQFAYHLDPGAADVRVNGVLQPGRARLRDGDVITVGGTSLRLAALCGPNFHWGEPGGD